MGAENIAEFEAVRAGPEALEQFINRWAPALRTMTGEQLITGGIQKIRDGAPVMVGGPPAGAPGAPAEQKAS